MRTHIQICDARPSKTNPNAKFKVKTIAKNGELLQSSESLNDVKAVKTHIAAMKRAWNSQEVGVKILDATKGRKFVQSSIASDTI